MRTNRKLTITFACTAALATLGARAQASPFASWMSEDSHKSAPAEGGSTGGDTEKAKTKSANKGRAFGKLRQILKSEPTCHDVQQAALKFYKLEPERINRMAVATRVKALLPELSGSLNNSVGHTFTNTRDGLYPSYSLIQAGIDPMNTGAGSDNPDGYKERVQTNNDNLTWEVRGVWQLDRLAFNSEELDVKSLNSLEENLVREVTTLYYSRQRAIANLILQSPEEDEEIFYELLRLDEQTATIDALTGGYFASKAWKWEAEVKW
jgi:hypothetical protein